MKSLAASPLVVFITTLVLGSSVYAAIPGPTAGATDPSIYFEETFLPVYVNRNDTRSVTGSPGVATESGLGYDFRTTVGYAFWGQMLLGFTYNLYHLGTKRANVSGGANGLSETTEKNEYGPTIGYISGGWRGLLTVFLGGSQQVATKNFNDSGITGDVTIKNMGVSGFQLTAGYGFQVMSAIEVGPAIVYRSVSYSKQSKVNQLNAPENYSGVPLFSKTADATLSPMISLLVRF